MTNLVIILSDQLRADITYHQHYPFVKTPNLDRLRGEGITFRNAFCQYPVCAPSRASLLTGRYPQQHGVLNNRCLLPPEERTMGHHFHDLGYEAVAFGKTHGQNPGFRRFPEPPIAESLGASRWGYLKGQSMLETTGKQRRDDDDLLIGTFDRPVEEHYDHVVNHQVERFLARRDAGRPLVLFVGYHTPHPPLFPPKHLADLYSRRDFELPRADDQQGPAKPGIQRQPGTHWVPPSPAAIRRLIAAYLALVTHVDECVGELLQILADRRLLEDSLLVFLADHGDQLGEHSMLGKFNNFYEGSLRAPLILHLPGQRYAGLELEDLVELVDVYPTACDVLGVSRPRGLAGKSLAPLFDAPAATHKESVHSVLVEKRASAVDTPCSGEALVQGTMIRTPRWKLAVYNVDIGELYDLQRDPGETTNLFGHPDYIGLKAQLMEQMMQHSLECLRDPTLWGANHFPG